MQTADVIEFKARMNGSRFDVVFLDLLLPGLQAHVALGALRSDYPHTKIIGLGDTNDSASIIRCFEDGLGGYISRSCSGINLIPTLKVIATPDLFISTGSSEPTRAAMLVEPAIEIVPPVPAREAETAPHPLTARQSDVLTLLAEGRTTKDIARRLGLAVPTVKTNLAAVYRQLGARNRPQAVVKAGAMASAAPAVTSMMRGMSQGEMFDRTFAAG